MEDRHCVHVFHNQQLISVNELQKQNQLHKPIPIVLKYDVIFGLVVGAYRTPNRNKVVWGNTPDQNKVVWENTPNRDIEEYIISEKCL